MTQGDVPDPALALRKARNHENLRRRLLGTGGALKAAVRFMLAAALPFLASSALAYELNLDASDSPQRVSGDVAYVIDANSPDMTFAQAQPAIDAAFASWAEASQGRLAFADQGPTQLGPPASGDARLGVPVTISWALNEWSYEGDDQAVTILVEDPDSHVILRADIVLNGVTHHWANLTDGQSHPGADDLQNTMTHEIGHLVGFAHTADPTSTMHPGTHPGDLTLRTLDAGDVAGIDALYAAVPTVQELAAGCATGAGTESSLTLLLGLALLIRRRRAR